jgi:hypothetical protein
MAERDGQGIGRVGAHRIGAGQLHPHHVVDLPLVRVACTDHGLLDGVGRVFGNRNAGRGGNQHRDTARLAQLQRSGPVPIHEGHLDRSCVRTVACHDRGQLEMQRQEPLRQIIAIGPALPVRDVSQTAAIDIDDAPTEASQARIDSDNAHALPRSLPALNLPHPFSNARPMLGTAR